MFASRAVLGATPRARAGGASERANAGSERTTGVAPRRAAVTTAGTAARECRPPAASRLLADGTKMFARLRGPARARVRARAASRAGAS